jgi:hypothetical protein
LKSTPAVPFAKLIPYPVPEVLFNVFTVNVDPVPSTLKVSLLVSLAYIPVGVLPVLFMVLCQLGGSKSNSKHYEIRN